jgi:hypothetical protein
MRRLLERLIRPSRESLESRRREIARARFWAELRAGEREAEEKSQTWPDDLTISGSDARGTNESDQEAGSTGGLVP